MRSNRHFCIKLSCFIKTDLRGLQRQSRYPTNTSTFDCIIFYAFLDTVTDLANPLHQTCPQFLSANYQSTAGDSKLESMSSFLMNLPEIQLPS